MMCSRGHKQIYNLKLFESKALDKCDNGKKVLTKFQIHR